MCAVQACRLIKKKLDVAWPALLTTLTRPACQPDLELQSRPHIERPDACRAEQDIAISEDEGEAEPQQLDISWPDLLTTLARMARQPGPDLLEQTAALEAAKRWRIAVRLAARVCSLVDQATEASLTAALQLQLQLARQAACTPSMPPAAGAHCRPRTCQALAHRGAHALSRQPLLALKFPVIPTNSCQTVPSVSVQTRARVCAYTCSTAGSCSPASVNSISPQERRCLTDPCIVLQAIAQAKTSLRKRGASKAEPEAHAWEEDCMASKHKPASCVHWLQVFPAGHSTGKPAQARRQQSRAQAEGLGGGRLVRLAPTRIMHAAQNA